MTSLEPPAMPEGSPDPEQRILLAIDQLNAKPPQELIVAAWSGFIMRLRAEGRIPAGLVMTAFGPTGELRQVLDYLRGDLPAELPASVLAEWDQRYAMIKQYADHAGVIVYGLAKRDDRDSPSDLIVP